jgi:hypothetical protein
MSIKKEFKFECRVEDCTCRRQVVAQVDTGCAHRNLRAPPKPRGRLLRASRALRTIVRTSGISIGCQNPQRNLCGQSSNLVRLTMTLRDNQTTRRNPRRPPRFSKPPLIDLPEIPSELKLLKPYIQRAKELQFTDRVMQCYWCK